MNRTMKAYAVPAGILLVAAAALFLARDHKYATEIIILILLHGLLAMAWNLAAGFTGLMSLGNSLFVGLGAYAVAYGVSGPHWNIWTSALLGVGLAVTAALVIGALCFRYGVRGYYFGIATLAFSEIAFFVASATPQLGRADGIMLPARELGWRNFYFDEKWPYGLAMLVLLAVFLLLCTHLLRSRAGSYWRSIRDNEEAADALGVPVMRYKQLAFALSAAFSAAAGAFLAAHIDFVDPRSVLGAEVSVQVLVFSIVGGIAHLWGPLLGAVILIPLNEALRIFTGGTVPGIGVMVYAVVLVLLSLYLPGGLSSLRLRLPNRGLRARLPGSGTEVGAR